MDRRQLLKRIDKAWRAFQGSHAGLSDSQMTEPGVTKAWSVRDILAHVTTWEGEALKHLPLILKGGKPPRYSVTYGSIDAFNAQMTKRKKGLSLPQVLRELNDTHRRLIDFIERARPKINSAAKRASVIAFGSTRIATILNTPRQYGNGESNAEVYERPS